MKRTTPQKGKRVMVADDPKVEVTDDQDIIAQILENMTMSSMALGIDIQLPTEKQPVGMSEVERHLRDSIRHRQRGTEIEASFGSFDSKKGSNHMSFVPGVTRNAFLRILKLFDFEDEVVNDVVSITAPIETFYKSKTEFGKAVARKIQKDGFETFELKQRSHFHSEQDASYRISSSLEVQEADIPEDLLRVLKESPNLFSYKRYRTRSTARLDGFRVDITQVNAGKNYVYEVEVEIESDADEKIIPTFLKVIKDINKARTPSFALETLPKYQTLAAVELNRLIRPNEHPSIHFKDTSLVRPINLTLDDLLSDEFPALTLKLDGKRAILFSSPANGVFMFVDGEVGFLADPIQGETIILDGEFYEGTYYAFDCIYHKSDISGLPFKNRFEILNKTLELFKTKTISIVVKEYKFSDNARAFYDNVTELYAEIAEEPEKYDGIIYQPLGSYYEKEPRKWKPEDRQTGDFKIQRKEGGYELLVTQTFPNGDYKIIPYPAFKYPVHIEGAPDDIEGRIAELLVKANGNTPEFYFKNYRDEKSRPNAVITINDVWRDVRKPISVNTICGEDTVLVRRYFNKEKESMIMRYFENLKRLGDVGSGQGGDIKKWKEAKISEVQCYEPDPEKIEEFNRRLASTRLGKQKVQIHQIGFEETQKVVGSLRRAPLNGVAAFFSLTFFGKDESMMNSLIETFDATMSSGSYLVGIVFDGEKVKDFMRSKQKVEESKDMISIEGKIDSKIKFGNSVTVNFGAEGETFIQDVKEYIFPFDEFEQKLINKGYRKISSDFFRGHETLPPVSKHWLDMNRYFIFIKGDAIPTKRQVFTFDEIGLEIRHIDNLGPDNLIEAVAVGLGTKLDPKEIRVQMSSYPIERWEKLDGGQLAGGYQQLARSQILASKDKKQAVAKRFGTYLGPKEYSQLGYEIWQNDIRNPSSVLGPRLGVELLSILLNTAIEVYSQLGKIEHIYFKQKEIAAKYPKKVKLVYNGVHFEPLFLLEKFVHANSLITSEQMEKFGDNYRNLGTFLKRLNFPFIGDQIPTKEIAEFHESPVEIKENVKWSYENFKLPKQVKVVQFTKSKNLPRYFDSASDPFMQERRMSCKVKGYPSPIEYWSSDLAMLAKELISYWKQTKKDITVEDVHDALYRVNGLKVCTEFHLSYAMGVMSFLTKGIKRPNVLDPCAGHGARLIAALKLGYGYTGVDPDVSLRKGHEGIIDAYHRANSPMPDIIYDRAESVELSPESYDLVFTSPPYFDYEIYSQDPSQSTTGNTPFQTWVDDFLEPMLSNAWDALRVGGNFAIHIQDVPKASLVEATISAMRKIKSARMTYLLALMGDSGKNRPVWVWTKQA